MRHPHVTNRVCRQNQIYKKIYIQYFHYKHEDGKGKNNTTLLRSSKTDFMGLAGSRVKKPEVKLSPMWDDGALPFFHLFKRF